ncbi:MAG: arylesterase [Wenzhouxiangella sp.]
MNPGSALTAVWLIALMCLVPGPAQAAGSLLIIGDSLSDAYGMAREMGWAHQLDERLGPELSVVNASISGETSFGGRSRLPGLLDQHEPDWVLIILGGNDGLRALSPAQLRENLGSMIEQAQRRDIAVALMQIRLPANLGPAYLRRFEAVYVDLAAAHDIPLLPFFLETIFDQPGMMMADGIHPAEAAQPLMLEALLPDLQSWIKGSDSAGLPTPN